MRVRVASARPVTAAAVGVTLLLVALSGCAGSAGIAATPSPLTAPSPWSYAGEHGPSEWGANCATSTTSKQSPVAIATASLQEKGSASLRLYYHPAAFRVENTGHGIEAVPEDPSANAIEVDGTTYHLRRLRFHAASEHMVDGIASDAELHLVHEADDGRSTVLAVLLRSGTAHEALGELFSSLPANAALPGRAGALERPIDPSELVPAAARIAQYEGSLTTPPCSEGVLWNVFLSPASVSPEQLSALTALYPGNHRPIQPLNGRTLTAATVG